MRCARIVHLLAFSMVALCVPPVLCAQPCAGFNDVDNASPFCPNVEWLKNRGVTTGCALTLYCPTQPVSRLSMAVFLQRLGNAIAPTVYAGYNAGSSLDLDASPVLCPTTFHTPPFAQKAHGVGYVLGWTTPALSMDVTVTPVRRESLTAPWTPVSAVPGSSWSATGNGMRKGAVVLLPPQPLSPGVSVQWGLRVGRTAGSATSGDFLGWNCQIHVEFENRITTSSPFDVE